LYYEIYDIEESYCFFVVRLKNSTGGEEQSQYAEVNKARKIRQNIHLIPKG
jgi:hypothetical protein